MLCEATAAAGDGINCCLQISKSIKAETKDAAAGKVCNQDVPKVLIESIEFTPNTGFKKLWDPKCQERADFKWRLLEKKSKFLIGRPKFLIGYPENKVW